MFRIRYAHLQLVRAQNYIRAQAGELLTEWVAPLTPGGRGSKAPKTGPKTGNRLIGRPGPKANGGAARPHGGAAHNAAIDTRVDCLTKRGGVKNIRKNQVQVDVKGNRVGNNRPDLQWDEWDPKGKKWVHMVEEYDNVAANSRRHMEQIRANDPTVRATGHILD